MRKLPDTLLRTLYMKYVRHQVEDMEASGLIEFARAVENESLSLNFVDRMHQINGRLALERDHANLKYERTARILVCIHYLLNPPPVTTENGALRFVNPNANEVLDELSRRIRAIPDDLATHLPPRATGCPDTMDDTGHFAEVDMPAFLKRQAPG